MPHEYSDGLHEGTLPEPIQPVNQTPNGQQKPDENADMSLVDHLADLRKRIIWTLVWFMIFLVGSFYYVGDIFNWLQSSVKTDIKLTVLGPTEVIRIYLMVAGLAAMILTLPIAIYQVWRFVAPALTPKEQRVTLTFIPGITLTFVAGLAFGFFFIFPVLFQFLMTLGAQDFAMMITADKYFGFMMNIVIPFGFLFELPVVVMFLTRLGIVTPQFLSKNRKYAYFLLVVVGVVLSPPDFMSDFIVSMPLLLLYEISVALSKWTYKRRLKALAAEGLAE